MGTNRIRAIILQARAHEEQTHALETGFEQRLETLEKRLVLPERDPVRSLVHFVGQYIDYVPVFIDGAEEISHQTGIFEYVAPFLHMAEDYFLAPPQEVGLDTGLRALLDEAYLAQRLIEEVNDRHIGRYRSALLPLDVTRANIIVHHLIGDPLATRLDALVEQTVNRLIDAEHAFERNDVVEAAEAGAVGAWKGLPCLSRSVAIDLRI